MYDGPKIVLGLVVFAGIATFPVWYQHGAARPRPELKLGTAEKQCVLPVEEMRATHMELLDRWRLAVVRDGVHQTTRRDGRPVRMSLTQTCLGCHAERKDFCDRCHNYAAVTLTCWDCHLDRTPAATAATTTTAAEAHR